jgi:catechol 2,3-dioxygenase-like lactoylglutathione lyase family enzyme
MRIIGPDSLVFGVPNPKECHQYLLDYGLKQTDASAGPGGSYEALDGTGITFYEADDDRLPPPLPTKNSLRQIVWGCVDQAAVDEVAAELKKDREVIEQADGSIWAQDDLGFQIAFRVTTRRELSFGGEVVNSPGAKVKREVNKLGTECETGALPNTLSHVVLFVPDIVKMEAFYAERLGFVTTDRFTGLGPFMRAGSNADHHSLFFMQTPPFMQGIEHLAFHMQGPNEVMVAGTRLKDKGVKPFWGPGRHIFGSNWFWYFKSPFGCHFEYDADMDLHDDSWVPREAAPGADASQTFLFRYEEKWMPGGDKH